MHFANAERSAQHAHVGVNAAEHDVADAMLDEQVINLATLIADGILRRHFDRRMLALPRDIHLINGVAPAIGIVDRQRRFNRQIAHVPMKRHRRLRQRRFLRPLALRRIFIKRHRIARHARSGSPSPASPWPPHRSSAPSRRRARGAVAPVLVPQVADDERRLLGIEIDGLFDNLKLPALWRDLRPAPAQ